MLKITNLSVTYNGHPVLKNVSFNVQAGSVFGVIGPNGAGKTTLVRAISGVAPLLSGQVMVDGIDLLSLKAVDRARRVAVVPQARNLPLAFTGWELVQLGRTPYLNWLGQMSEADEQRVTLALKRAQALDIAGRRLGDLSGGEQQRLLLARALAQEAPILLLDEPTTHLDLQYQIGILDKVRELAHRDGITVVVVLHDLNLVSRYADQVALLVNGELRANGTPAEVLDPVLLGEVYHLPLQVLTGTTSGRPVILPAVL